MSPNLPRDHSLQETQGGPASGAVRGAERGQLGVVGQAERGRLDVGGQAELGQRCKGAERD